jgi:hypothetical protein
VTQEDFGDLRGNNGSLRQNLSDSREFRELRRAIAKAHGDRARAIKAICRLYTVPDFDRLPAPVWSAALSLLPYDWVERFVPGEMHMRVRNLRSVEKRLLAMAAVAIVWFGFIEERFFPLPEPPIDPLTPLILCIAVFVLYWLLGLIYILVAHRSS